LTLAASFSHAPSAPRRLADLTGEYQLSRRSALFGNNRNLADTSEDFGRWGPQPPGYARFRQRYRQGVRGNL